MKYSERFSRWKNARVSPGHGAIAHSTPSGWVWLDRAVGLSQIGLVVIAAFVVVPTYQKSVLEEDVAKLRIESAQLKKQHQLLQLQAYDHYLEVVTNLALRTGNTLWQCAKGETIRDTSHERFERCLIERAGAIKHRALRREDSERYLPIVKSLIPRYLAEVTTINQKAAADRKSLEQALERQMAEDQRTILKKGLEALEASYQLRLTDVCANIAFDALNRLVGGVAQPKIVQSP